MSSSYNNTALLLLLLVSRFIIKVTLWTNMPKVACRLKDASCHMFTCIISLITSSCVLTSYKLKLCVDTK